MMKIRRLMLAFLMSFAFLGLAACDDGVDGNAGNGAGTELEEEVE